MLALDSTIGCIEVSESDVVDIYRSAPITRSSDKRAETTEAYICAIKKKTLVKVYFALVVNDHKIYVYSTPGKGKSEAEYPKDVEKAISYAKAMGFAPERVDLSYSPAMREVVVRNTKVLRLAGTKGSGGLKHGLAGAPVLPMLRHNEIDIPEPPADIPISAPTPAAAPIAAPIAATVGTPAAEGSRVAELENALTQFQHELRTLVTERDDLSKKLQQLSAQHHDAVTQLAAARKSGEELAGARDALLSRQRQVDEDVAGKETEISQLKKQAAELRLESKALSDKYAEMSREHDAMVENLAQARQDLAALCAERDAALAGAGAATQQHQETAAQLEETRHELERTVVETAQARLRIETLEATVRKQEQELTTLRLDLTGVTSERDEARQGLAAQDGTKESAEAEVVLLRKELEQVRAERDAKSDQGEVAHLRQELVRLEAERDAALRRIAAREDREAGQVEKPGHEPELERPQQGMPEPAEDAAPATAADHGNEPSPILPGLQDAASEPFPAFTESTLPPFAELETPPDMGPWDTATGALEVAAPAETGAGFSFGGVENSFVPLGDLHDAGFFSAADDDEPVRFLLETGLDAIDCPAAEDVLELHQSINNAYLSPEGTGGQESCQGYICCVLKEKKKQVFAAIYGTKSHRTRVYLPESQPKDDESYARTVRSAINFAEEVGLMMERVPLETTGQKRQESLKRCPALRVAEAK
ncbi:hypothetical protein KP004_03565 [Geomonas oryzisoli]|uniref:Uncharacterized protein n=1 Tax=Geomonas oryzisoli TaxID=2847992 RepID=A0ABX8JB20_9BACT|nr:hypothetical protein [Geomonas oryzisoli]QWV94276.1 hypothetical protein KP004_03565 [Geomonas oryzisoli]